MTGLSDLIPAPEPAENTFATVLGMGLDAIPVVGPLAGRALDHALAARAAERRHAFDIAIVNELTRLAEELDHELTIAAVVTSEDFIATLARAQREAAETASESKRARLARAAVATLRPSALTRAERSLFLRHAAEFEDLHVWLLHYFADPAAWLASHGLHGTYEHRGYNSVHVPLAAALGNPSEADWDVVVATADELSRLGLITGTIGGASTEEGTTLRRLAERGARFLSFISESEMERPSPPSL